MKFELKNTGDRELNDVELSALFETRGYTYVFNFTPHCDFWRVGFRFIFKSKASGSTLSQNSRYNDNQIRHLELCAGEVKDGIWTNPNKLQLQHYYFRGLPSPSISGCSTYVLQSQVEVRIKSLNDGKIEISYQAEGCELRSHTLDPEFRACFKVCAWADNVDFNIDGTVIPQFDPLPIQLGNVKALAQQTIVLTIHRFASLFGPNNCGKTSVLVGICSSFNSDQDFTVDYLGLNRFYSEIGYDFQLENLPERERRRRDNRKSRCADQGQNAPYNWLEELSLQDDKTRENIKEWYSANFEEWTFLDKTSGRYLIGKEVMVNGRKVLDQGTGGRAVLPIIIQLFDPDVKLLAIDEPELGLEPKTQKILFQAIQDASNGENGFPNKRVIIATHSHLFLDRASPKNNFSIQKRDGVVSINQVADGVELQRATYDLLGCNPDDLFFPTNIVGVEGPSDAIFIEAVYKKMLQDGLITKQNIVFHYVDGIDNAETGLLAMLQMFKTQAYCPIYKDKICGIFDGALTDKRKKMIEKVKKFFDVDSHQRFIVLEKAAIEYYYPVQVLNRIFGGTLANTNIEHEVMKFLQAASKSPKGTLFGHELSKVDLAKLVANEISNNPTDDLDISIRNLIKEAADRAY